MSHSFKARVLALALAGGLAAPVPFVALAARAAPAQAAATVTVRIDNFVFGPAAITVAPGTTVTWVNQDDIPHNIVADDKQTFRSKVLDTDESYSFTFTKPGEYGYFCGLHPHMTGKVIVKAG
ncbi:cupredoxin family copper-binding protein [Phenylobacterium sp.]|jgi:plastocyanin|uniref:cupredoxin domain-containing protein n=1 Tax=Phenylobacterium sp. TaxID=1871053 RepID=UPI002F427257